jgi:hypothetical protein
MAQIAQQERQIDANFAMNQQEKQEAKIQLRVQSAVEQLDKYSDPSIADALDTANTPFKRTFGDEDIQNLATFRDIVKRNLDTISMYDPATANQMKLKLAESVIPALEGITSPSFNRKWNSRWAPMFGNAWTRGPGKNLKQAQSVASEIQQMLMSQ